MIGLLSALLGSAASAVPPEPPVVSVGVPTASASDGSSGQRLVSWMPGPVRCENGEVASVVEGRRPYNTLWSGRGSEPPAMSFDFAIDATGRPVSITRTSPSHSNHGSGAAAMVSSRFAANAALDGCSITYRPVMRPIEEAEPVELVSYVMTGQTPRLSREAYDRLHADDECRAGTQPILRAYPNFDQIPATPGVRDWTAIGFDVKPSGETSNVRHLYGTGNEPLDGAAEEAVETSRFNEGPMRHNCSYRYWRNAAVLPAPPAPPRGADWSDPCEALEWDRAPQLVFREAYRSRSIEGWADIAYDVAPWGEIGNVRILRAEPIDDFGEAAKRMIERSSKQEGQAITGCETRVFYRMEGNAASARDSESS